jgi:hypothetical protein
MQRQRLTVNSSLMLDLSVCMDVVPVYDPSSIKDAMGFAIFAQPAFSREMPPVGQKHATSPLYGRVVSGFSRIILGIRGQHIATRYLISPYAKK